MPVIRIDEQVEAELKRLAVDYGLVFGTPNQVLREHLELDGETQESGEEAAMTSEQRGGERRLSGRRLAVQHGLQVAQSYAHVGGTWYTVPAEFPAVLFDGEGYIAFQTKVEFDVCSGLNVGQTLNVYQGIASIPGYIRCEHSH